ncbi:MAG: hypothetical protein OXH65_11965 [Paracoccaceae bacterium]|nr:hypothetical protein [Paracoccaceae bacterium]MDE2675811.1 hypothetical protein [Paracoccaceae bacterium]
MPDRDFHKNVFINCPFYDEYKLILEAILFCLIRLGFKPRIATERQDSGESRLDKIQELIRCSKYSIHDLSRCVSTSSGELHRMNMPFELGLDFGCRNFGGPPFDQKRILILEKKQYRYKEFISDLSGNDIEPHDNQYDKAIEKVFYWIRSFDNSGSNVTANMVTGEYEQFWGDHYDDLWAKGYKDDDIENLPTNELINAIIQWLQPEQNP